MQAVACTRHPPPGHRDFCAFWFKSVGMGDSAEFSIGVKVKILRKRANRSFVPDICQVSDTHRVRPEFQSGIWFGSCHVKCFRCGNYGHYRSECYTNMNKAKDARANFAEKEKEDEGAILMVCQTMEKPQKNVWYLDTGCSNHMYGEKLIFSTLDESFTNTVRFRDDTKVSILGKGDIKIWAKDNTINTISSVFLGQLDEKGYEIKIIGGACQIHDQKRGLIAKAYMTTNRMFPLHIHSDGPTCFSTKVNDPAWLWHLCYGHLNFRGLKTLHDKEVVTGLPQITCPTEVCEVCVVGKQHRETFLRGKAWRALRPLQLQKTWVYFLQEKSEALNAFKHFKAAAKNEIEKTIKVLRTYCGGEYNSKAFENFCAIHGIRRQLMAAYTPQQSEAWSGRKPTVGYFKVFGCIAYARIPDENRKKLDDKCEKCFPRRISYSIMCPKMLYLMKKRPACAQPQRLKKRPACMKDSESVFDSVSGSEGNSDPMSFFDAVKEPKWQKAMDEEIKSIEKNNTWELTELPQGHKTIGFKWVFKTKLNEKGEIHKHKARLVAKGYKQEYGVYVEQPTGYVQSGKERQVYRLKKALYGLKQAPKAWFVMKECNSVCTPTEIGLKLVKNSGEKKGTIDFGILYKKKLNQIVTLSTTEAEFIAWLRRILEELSGLQDGPTPVYCDNSSAIKLSKNPVLHGKSKHIDVHYHFLRDLTKDGTIDLIYCISEDQVADILTKRLKLPVFSKPRRFTSSHLCLDFEFNSTRRTTTALTISRQELSTPYVLSQQRGQ
ncbi:hypothetical protein Prudu_005670 [Prunus dulcis]|uniref:CCHC-type domain-containing protein n=1 Tax=Prunus dulcis TaxID=3755 RepID=A0A4Y1QY40_PRUDU|nr:hypothetical protein Prudu_005670 [Prunus dulcis]